MAAFSFNPKQEKLFALLEQLAESICEASLIVSKFVLDSAYPEYQLRLIKAVKKRGDKIVLLLGQQISRQFVLPFDPEDVLVLVRELNNCLSHVANIMEKIVAYKVYPLKDQELLAMITILDNMVREIYHLTVKLRCLGSKREQIIKKCEQISDYKERSNYCYLSGIGSLFDQENFNVPYFLKLKEIYSQIELSLNSCNNVNNTVKEMTVKYV